MLKPELNIARNKGYTAKANIIKEYCICWWGCRKSINKFVMIFFLNKLSKDEKH